MLECKPSSTQARAEVSSVSKVAFKVGLDGAELGLKRRGLAYSYCLKFLLEREEQARQVLEGFVFHGDVRSLRVGSK